MFYYAVKTGREPGVYTDWESCQKQIYKYSGAEFKKFESIEDARDYIAQERPQQEPINKGLPEAYIDGSFSKIHQIYSYGGYIRQGDKLHIIQGTGNDPQFIKERNIAGELLGALQVLYTAKLLQIPEINIYHDYIGIKKYLDGSWTTKTVLAQYFYKQASAMHNDVIAHYIHIPGHTGIEGNELADILAKEAAGTTLRKKDVAALADLRQRAAGAEQRRGETE